MQQRLAHQNTTTQQSLVNLVFVFALRPLNRPSRIGGVDAQRARPGIALQDTPTGLCTTARRPEPHMHIHARCRHSRAACKRPFTHARFPEPDA